MSTWRKVGYCLIAVAAAFAVQAEVKWTYDSTSGTLTEILPGESADTPWIFPYSSDGVIGRFTQKGTSVVIDLRPDAMPPGAPVLTQVGNGGFVNGTAVQEVYLPDDTVTKINSSAFTGCTSLRTLEPLLPNSVTKVGPQDVFRNCSALQGTLTFGGDDRPMQDLSADKRFMFCGMSSISAIVFGAGVNQTYFSFSMGGNWNNHGGYANMSSVESIVCRVKSTLDWSQALEWPEGIRTCLFQDMTKLREVEVCGWLSKANGLPAVASGNCRILVPGAQFNWTRFCAKATNVRSWATLSSAEQQAYWNRYYPDDEEAPTREAVPEGLSVAGNEIAMPAGYWIVFKPVEPKWIYDASAGTLTEVVAGDAKPWVFPLSSAGVLSKYTQAGVGTVLDFRPEIMPEGAPAIVELGTSFLADATKVTDLYLPENTITKIGGSTFNNCQSLKQMVPCIPDSITSIGLANVFRNCYALSGTLTIGGSDQPMNDWTGDKRYQFQNMSSIQELVFGAGVKQSYFDFKSTWVNHAGFAGCNAVTGIVCRVKTKLAWDSPAFSNEGVWTVLFQDMAKLRYVDVAGFLTSAKSLPARTSGKCRLFAPYGNSDWRDFAANRSGANLKLWTEMTAAEQQAYWDEFYPGDATAPVRELAPAGLSLAGNAIELPAGYWVILKRSSVQGWTYDANAQTLTEVVAPGVTPWVFPLSATGILGKRTQIGASTTLDFRPTSMPANAPSIVSLGTSFLESCTTVLEVYLPRDTITQINTSAFNGCTALTKIEPLLPDSVAYVGQQSVFRSCRALRGTLTIGGDGRTMTAISGDKRYLFQNMSSITELVYGEGIHNSYFLFCDGSYWTGHGGMAGMSSVTSIICRTTATMSWRQGVEYPEGVKTCLFNDMTRLQYVEVNGFISSGKGLPSTTSGQTRMLVPAGNADWQDFYGNVSTPTNVTPWADLTDAERQAYWDRFYPGDAGAPAREFTPAGITLAGNAITMPGGYWIVPKTKYALTIDLSFGNTDGVVDCTLSPASADGTYAPGTSVTVTLNLSAGVTFLGWSGPVAAADRQKTTITVTVDAVKTLKASFRTAFWSYDPESQTLTDGDWTFRTAGARTSLTVVETLKAGSSAALDFSREIRGGGAIVGIGQGALSGVPPVAQVTLPSTVTHIGAYAFADSDLLTVVFAGDRPTIAASAFPGEGRVRLRRLSRVASSGQGQGWCDKVGQSWRRRAGAVLGTLPQAVARRDNPVFAVERRRVVRAVVRRASPYGEIGLFAGFPVLG